MQVLMVTVNDEVSIVDVDFKDPNTVYEKIGGFEIVRTLSMLSYFNEPVVMLVDDNGYANGRKFNRIASLFYPGDIVGNALFVPEYFGEFNDFNDIHESFELLNIL